MNIPIISLLLIMFCACMPSISSDIYVPSLLSMASDLETTQHLAQWTLSVFMISSASTQLFYGPLAERYGRKPILIIGLFIMLLGTILALMAQNIQSLLLARCIQGLGAASCAALWRTVCHDMFTPTQFSVYGSFISAFIVFAVAAAPAIGGHLEAEGGWRLSFYVIAGLLTLLIILFTLTFKETKQSNSDQKLSLSVACAHYKTLVTSPMFSASLAAVLLSYGAFFAWSVVTPIIYMGPLNVSPVTFGWISFSVSGLSFTAGSFMNAYLVKRLGIVRMIQLGFSILIVSALLMLGLYESGIFAIWTIILPSILLYLGITFISPNAVAIAFAPFRHISGYAGAMYGFIQAAGAGLISGLAAQHSADTPTMIAIIALCCHSISLMLFRTFVFPKANEYLN